MAPIQALLDRFGGLRDVHQKHSRELPNAPPVSPNTAATLSVLFTLVYVLPFYISPATRPSPQLHRDAPSSIRARVRAVTLSTIVCYVLTILVLGQTGELSPHAIVRLLGLWPVSILDIFKTLLLVTVLFAGPLFEHAIVDGNLIHWLSGSPLTESLGSWIGYRNYVVGPVSEELIWRGMIIPLHIQAGFSGKQIIFLTPLYFGIAHVHHLYEFRLTHPLTPMLQAVARSLFQFTYTSLFGFFASFVFLRTGSVWSLILTHSFCNWLGLPRFWGRVGVEAGVPLGPPSSGKANEESRPRGRGMGWTIAYYAILVAGAYGFYRGLFPLTKSSNAMPVPLAES